MAEQSFLINDYRDLHFLFRSRANSVRVSRATLDGLCGVTSGYSQKVLAAEPKKGIGAALAIKMAKALGLAIVIVEDSAAAEKLSSVRRRDETRVRQRHAVTKEAAL